MTRKPLPPGRKVELWALRVFIVAALAYLAWKHFGAGR